MLALLPTLKMFLSVEISLEAIDAAAWSCSLKKVLSKTLKNLQESTSGGVSFLKNEDFFLLAWILQSLSSYFFVRISLKTHSKV